MKWKLAALVLLASALLRAEDRNLLLQVGRLSTDERIQFFQTLVSHQPEELRYQNLLALTDIQKTRETQDFANLDRASRIIDEVLAKDPYNYEALRVRSQIYLERHDFKRAAENSSRLIERSPQDPYNYGTFGDASIEQGRYEKAADAYQKMVALRPDLSSYNRAAYYRYILGDAKGAVEVMKRAVQAGSPSLPESTAWCLAELGKMEFQQGDLDQAEQAYRAALRVFPNHHTSLAGLAQVAAARGKLDQAIGWMKRSVAVVPFLDNVALLADYYELAG
ncbi:MAG TPA: tetratricopeptide repeat protein, partial [Bryobacterales bacterium]|nr:tetratricopeptide repeat protein [Bryobacterales bacterium]